MSAVISGINLTGDSSSYHRISDKLYIKAMTAFGVVGLLWFLLSRSLIRHQGSEVLVYSLFATSVMISLFLILIACVRVPHTGSGFETMLSIIKCVLYYSCPALLILVQLGVLIGIMSANSDYLYTNVDIPYIFNVFNMTAVVMLLVQMFVWNGIVKKILGKGGKINPMTVPGFILAFLLTSIAISQLYVILEFLRTDC